MRPLFFLFALLLPNISWAEQIKVFDSSSLLRASAQCKKVCQVAVSLSADSASTSLALTNLDGLQADLSSQVSEQGVVFSPISSGSWKIKASAPVTVVAIKISAAN